MTKTLSKIDELSRELLTCALMKPDPTDRLQMVANCFPELMNLEVGMDNPHHKDVTILDHCIEVCGYTPHTSPILRMAGLLHDIGKVACRQKKDDGNCSYRGHDEAGAEIAERFLDRLDFEREFIEDVALLVRLHMRPLQHFNQPMGSKGLRRLIRASQGHLVTFEDLMHLNEADILAHTEEVIERDLPKNFDLTLRLRRLNNDHTE